MILIKWDFQYDFNIVKKEPISGGVTFNFLISSINKDRI